MLRFNSEYDSLAGAAVRKHGAQSWDVETNVMTAWSMVEKLKNGKTPM